MPLTRTNAFEGLVERCHGNLLRDDHYADGRPLPLPHRVTITPHTQTTEYTVHNDISCEALQIYLVNEHLSALQGAAMRGIMHFVYASPPNTPARVLEVHARAVPACNRQRYWVDVTPTGPAIAASLANPGGPGGAFWVRPKTRGHL